MNRKSQKSTSPAARLAGSVDGSDRLLRCMTRRVLGVGCLAALALGNQAWGQSLAEPIVLRPQTRIALQDAADRTGQIEQTEPSDAVEEVPAGKDRDEVDSDSDRREPAEASPRGLDGNASGDDDAGKKTLRDALELLSDPEELRAPQRNDSDPIAQISSKSLFQGRRAEVSGNRFALPPIAALTTEMTEIGNGEVPEGFRKGEPSPQIDLPETGLDRGLPWQWYTQAWAAPNTFFHPLYFEDRMLERHGHQRFPHLTPLVSGGRFVAQAAMLPYLSAIHPPSECHYSLGYFRAGSPVPAFLQRPPYQRKAAAAQLTSSAIGWTIWP
jgi:hypothetical protein